MSSGPKPPDGRRGTADWLALDKAGSAPPVHGRRGPDPKTTLPVTPLQAWDESLRGRRFADLDEKRRRRYEPLKPVERDAWRNLQAERRLIEEFMRAKDRE